MRLKGLVQTWRYPVILLFSIGISGVGNWVYFIALNLIVLNMTGSALAVSVLYIVRALSTVFTTIWSGTLIDRLNKKYLMNHTKCIPNGANYDITFCVFFRVHLLYGIYYYHS